MSNKELYAICCPITSSTCSKAINWCNSSPKQNNVCFCDGEPDYCCNDCYFCFTPFTLVLDILCFPYNIYNNCQTCKKEREDEKENNEDNNEENNEDNNKDIKKENQINIVAI